jgi:hypothetical protein
MAVTDTIVDTGSYGGALPKEQGENQSPTSKPPRRLVHPLAS